MAELLGPTRIDYDDPNVNLYDYSKASKAEGYLSSMVEAWETTPTVADIRSSELKRKDLKTYSPFREGQPGSSSYKPEAGENPDDRVAHLFDNREAYVVDEDTWKRKYSDKGLKFEPNHTDEFWKINANLKQEEIMRARDIKSAEVGAMMRFTTAIVPNLLDPINIASAFVPVARLGFIAGGVAKVGGGALGKATVAGAIEGSVGNILPEVMVYSALTKDRQYDYDQYDMLSNIAMGAVVGGVFHAAFGRGQYSTAQNKVLDAIDNGKKIDIVDNLDEAGTKKVLSDPVAVEDRYKTFLKERDLIDTPETKVDFEKLISAEKDVPVIEKLKEEDRLAAERSDYESEATIRDELSSQDAARDASLFEHEISKYGTDDGMEFATAKEAEAHEEGLRPGQQAQRNLVTSYGKPIKITTQVIAVAFKNVATEVYVRLKELQFKKDVNGERLLSTPDFAYITDRVVTIKDKIDLYTQHINDFYTRGKEWMSSSVTPNPLWQDFARSEKWGNNEETQKFMLYIAKRFDGLYKANMPVDEIPKVILQDMTTNARQQLTTSVLSMVKYTENLDRIIRLAKENKAGGLTEANVLLGDMIGSTTVGGTGFTKHYAGMKNSIDTTFKAIERGTLGKLRGMLEGVKLENGKSLWDMVEGTRTTVPWAWMGKIPNIVGDKWFRVGDKEFQLQIRKELWSIDLKTGKPTLNANPQAAKIAEIIHGINRELVERQNNAGAHINLADEYGARQRHMREKLLYSEKTVEESKVAWKTYTLGLLDTVKSFGVKTAKEIDVILDDIYSHLTMGGEKKRGYDTDFNENYGFNFGVEERGKPLGDLVSKERVLMFKNAEAQHAYDMKYGSGDLMDNIYNSISKASGNIALMERFGPDPEGVFGKLLGKLNTLARERTDMKLSEDITGKKGAWLKQAYNDVSGKAQMPTDISLARMARGARAWQVITKLGTAAVSSFGDVMTSAMEMKFQGMGGFKAYGTALQNVFSLFSKDADKKEAARLLGIGLDGMISDVMSRYADPSEFSGKMSKAMGLMFKMNGLEHWTDSHKFATGLMLSSHIAEQRGLDWAGLAAANKKLHSQLSEYGFDAVDWEIIRNHGISEVNGNRFVTGDAMSAIPNNVIKEIAGSKLSDIAFELKSAMDNATRTEILDEAINNYRRDLGDKLRAYLIDRTDHAIPTPGARQRIYMRGGTETGTVWGELNRFFWQFKAFPVTVFQQATEKAQVQGAWAGTGSMLELAAGLTVLGYLSLITKDAIQGKTPRDFTDLGTTKGWRVLGDSIAQGGVLGIYGDLLLSEARTYGQNPLTRFAGPTAGTAMDAVGLGQDVKRIITGEKKAKEKLAADSVNFMRRHVIPGLQFPIVKQMMDYGLIHSIQEGLNPGYLDRIENNLRKERDQRYFDSDMNFANPRNRLRTFE